MPEKKKTRVSDKIKFDTYIANVLKQVHPDSHISSKAKGAVNDFCNFFLKALASEASKVATFEKKKTITARTIQTALRLMVQGELAKHAVSEGTKAITKFNSEKKNGSLARKAGLVFPPSRCRKFLTQSETRGFRAGSHPGVYMAAVVEYLCAEILELAGNSARERKKVTISMKDLTLAVFNDSELTHLMKHLKIKLFNAGMISGMPTESLPEKNSRKDGKMTSKIRFYQKQSECATLPRAAFSRVTKEVAQDMITDGVLRKDAIALIQGYVEQHLVETCQNAYAIALQAGRKTLTVKDIQLARHIAGEHE
jgi:histone H2B